MNIKCPKCGNGQFYGTQTVRGTIAVIVSLGGDMPCFISNKDGSDMLDPMDLDFGNPQGPFICTKCEAEVDSRGTLLV